MRLFTLGSAGRITLELHLGPGQITTFSQLRIVMVGFTLGTIAFMLPGDTIPDGGMVVDIMQNGLKPPLPLST